MENSLAPQNFVSGVFYEIRYQFKTAGKEILHFLLKSGSDSRDHAGDIFCDNNVENDTSSADGAAPLDIRRYLTHLPLYYLPSSLSFLLPLKR